MNERKIRIIKTPPGFAPEDIRKQWIGIEIPIIGEEDSTQPLGVRSGIENIGGYQVSPLEAIKALKEAGKTEAVAFWQRFSSAMNFTFKKEVCEVI